MEEQQLEPIDLSHLIQKPYRNSQIDIFKSLLKTKDNTNCVENENSNSSKNFENLLQSIAIKTDEEKKELKNLSNQRENEIPYFIEGYEDIQENSIEMEENKIVGLNGVKKTSKIQTCLKWFEEEKKKLVPTDIFPTDYKISTITTNCRIVYQDIEPKHIFVNYLKFFKYLELEEKEIESKKYRFMSKRYNWDDFRASKKPEQNQYNKSQKKENSKMKGIFYNQITLEIYSKVSNKIITVFLYDNGSMNNTGNKCIEDTKFVSDLVIKNLIRVHNKFPILYFYERKPNLSMRTKKKNKQNSLDLTTDEIPEDVTILDLSNWENKNEDILDAFLNEKLKVIGQIDDISKLKLLEDKISISTMNAQYNIGINLIREQIYEVVKNNNDNKQECGTNDGIYFVILQTSNYAGINIKIKWKKDCNSDIHIKSKKKWRCKCRDITILAFQSGEIMISGARSFEELDYAKSLFDDLIRKNLERVVDIDLSSIIPIPSQKKAKRIEKHLGTEYLQGKKFDVYDYTTNETVNIPVKVERRGRKPKNRQMNYESSSSMTNLTLNELVNSITYVPKIH